MKLFICHEGGIVSVGRQIPSPPSVGRSRSHARNGRWDGWTFTSLVHLCVCLFGRTELGALESVICSQAWELVLCPDLGGDDEVWISSVLGVDPALR